jgi:conjugal transfer mating pair stabilization protein TraG
VAAVAAVEAPRLADPNLINGFYPPPEATPSSAGGMPMTNADRDALIKTISGEAGSESPAGQSAVVSVILNRLKAGGYGNSISDIVHAPAAGTNPNRGYKEFSMWNTAPAKGGNQGGAIGPGDPNYARIGDLVDKVYSGLIPDPTGGATHYYAPKLMPGGRPPAQWPQGWFNSQPKTKVGTQIFVGGPYGPGQSPSDVSNMLI